MTLVDRELGALHLSRIYHRQIREGLLRQWSCRYPEALPRRGLEKRRVLHDLADLCELARKMLGEPPEDP